MPMIRMLVSTSVLTNGEPADDTEVPIATRSASWLVTGAARLRRQTRTLCLCDGYPHLRAPYTPEPRFLSLAGTACRRKRHRPNAPNSTPIETFNGCLRDECLNLHWFKTIAEEADS
jgi:hypothetical protein